MSTVGYGDITPKTAPERVVAIVLMCAGRAQQSMTLQKVPAPSHPDPACVSRTLLHPADGFTHGSGQVHTIGPHPRVALQG